MRETVEAYLEKLTKQNACVIGFLNPGASDSNLALLQTLEDCTIPADLKAMWRVFNGTKTLDEVTYDQIWLDGTFGYFSAQHAVEDYKTSEKLWATEPEFEDYLPRGFLPIGSPGDGSRLLVNCRKDSPTYGGVYELSHGIGLSRHADSLRSYFSTISELFDKGATFVDQSGSIDFNEDQANTIAGKLNPNCDAYNDSLPWAYETQDWLQPDQGAQR